MQSQRDPRTKRELVSELTSMTFNGDLRSLGANGVDVLRTAPNRIELHFKGTGQTFELVVRKPSPTRQGVDTREIAAARRAPEGRSFEPSAAGLEDLIGGPSTDEQEYVAAPRGKQRQGIRPEEPRQRARAGHG